MGWCYGPDSACEGLTRDQQERLFKLEKRLYDSVWPMVVDQPPHLYHFTSETAVLGILRSRGLRFTHYQDLADRREIQYGRELVRAVLDFLSKISDQLSRDLTHLFGRFLAGIEGKDSYYIACFTEVRDSERHWQEFVGEGHGYALKFDTALLSKGSDKILFDVKPVEYDLKSQIDIITSVIYPALACGRNLVTRNPTDRTFPWMPHLASLLSAYTQYHLIRMKAPAFEWEREWRIVLRESVLSRARHLGAAKSSANGKRFAHIEFLDKPNCSPITGVCSRWCGHITIEDLARLGRKETKGQTV